VRTSTKGAVGVITLGALGLSYHFGQEAVVASGSFAAPSASASATPSTSSEPLPSASASASTDVAAGSAGSESINTNGGSVSKPSASASTSTAPAPQPSASATKNTTATSGSSATKTGSVVESGFGTVQVQVTKSNGKITDITMLQANATHGRAAAFPYLIQYAIAANGSNFANLGGATYTTNAFKQSLEAALAKF
jgi:uncharacterized protein with FMN-binding domain